MRSHHLSLLVLFLCVSLNSWAQQRTYQGTVKEASTGSPIAGATVQIVGKRQSTSSDRNGQFSIEANSTDILRLTSVGWKTVTETLGNQQTLLFQLEPDETSLGEIVVVGYGTQRKSDVTGSVSTIQVDKATAMATTNVNEMLRGQAPGVQVTLQSPRPGGNSSVLIRGTKSIQGGNSPLYVLDGYPIDDINQVNPEDIASLEVLKDASSQAIYGARASNGVILITTKKGTAGQSRISYSGYLTTQKLSKNFDLYSPQEFAQLRREAWRAKNAPTFDYPEDREMFDDFELEALKNNTYADWEKLVLRNALIQNHSIGFSGGTDKTKVYTNATYFKNRGLIIGSDYERLSLRNNLSHSLNDKLTFESNITFNIDKQDIESSGLNVISLSPLAKPFDENGELVKYPLGPNSLTINPLWNLRESTNERKTNLLNLNLALNYQIAPGLKYRLNTLLARDAGEKGTYLTRLHSAGSNTNGSASIVDNKRREYLIENILTYEKTFNDIHQLDLTAVQSVNEINYTTTNMTGTNFPNDILGYHGISDALNKNTIRTETKRNIASFMGRVRYGLLDKYLFSATARYDGSSVFAENEKWGIFPAASFAWKAHNEPFIQNISAINELKARVSYGSVGNQAIAPYQTLGTVGSNPYIFGNEIVGGNITGSNLPNPFLTWETSTTFNAGIDFALLNNRITGTFEYYNTQTKDLLVDISLAGGTGFSSTITNGGKSENKGIELALTGHLIRKEGLNWSITTMFSRNRNKILETGIYDINGEAKDDIARYRFVGQPINVIYEKKFDGIFQSEEEIKASAQATQNVIMPGSIRVIDKNGDGKIDDQDNFVFAQDPKWIGSFSTTLQYKSFDLYADLYVVHGATKLNPYLAQYETGGSLQGILNGIKIPYWTPENPSSEYPRPYRDTQSHLYSLAVQDASYIRLRTVTLGYTLPNMWSSKLKVNNLRFYVMANNLFTITDYKSYSPEVNPDSYPDAKAFTAGLKFDF
ncbi:SusC/RagA family TonB-linked outer membrane protein [Sphingobacterium yanglingense]|uniref:TonB-linked SusC/RagA family outer membrane protein n=1 Tax=Sphingobacterium yanglingense TaxID=1437280 RepID=A0A4R6WIZ8_9SPHI|nr:TonB-dependent receptor [Sphingobacterium yanglingense]TDQ80223.1 TonB-linked SusC/RagA family outer membrane protein [Sphingobacterium yanglingense]